LTCSFLEWAAAIRRYASAFSQPGLLRWVEHLGIITDEIRNIMESSTLSFAATIRVEGSPKLSPEFCQLSLQSPP
jgi:hypothetical protein